MNAPRIWFPAVVRWSPAGPLLMAEDEAAYRDHLRTLVGVRVEVEVKPYHRPPSQDLRGYYFAVLVELAMREFGYATKDEAHDAIVRGVLCSRWEKYRPSFADDAITHDEMAETVERICADFITECGLTVPDPDPDPVHRWEANHA